MRNACTTGTVGVEATKEQRTGTPWRALIAKSVACVLVGLALFGSVRPAVAGGIEDAKEKTEHRDETSLEAIRARDAARRALDPQEKSAADRVGDAVRGKLDKDERPSALRDSPPPIRHTLTKLEDGSFRVSAELVSSPDWDRIGPTLRGERVASLRNAR